jgi:hypothetical protein
MSLTVGHLTVQWNRLAMHRSDSARTVSFFSLSFFRMISIDFGSIGLPACAYDRSNLNG